MSSLSQVDIEEGVNGLYKMSHPKGLLALGRGSSRTKLCVNHQKADTEGSVCILENIVGVRGWYRWRCSWRCAGVSKEV